METFVFIYNYGAGDKMAIITAESEERARILLSAITKAEPDYFVQLHGDTEGVEYNSI
jgi:hypothetical protein